MAVRHLALRRTRRAFTFVELTIVILILGIMAAVAAPKYRSALANYRVNAAAQRVAADLRMVRQFARKDSRPQAVVFNATANSYTAPNMPDLNHPGVAYSLNLWSSDYATDIVSASFGGSATANFDVFGRPTAAGSVSLSSGELTATVTLDEAGHVSIL